MTRRPRFPRPIAALAAVCLLLAAEAAFAQSLEEAIQIAVRQNNVERVLSAWTQREGSVDVHHVKVLTKSGRVKVVRIADRRGRERRR